MSETVRVYACVHMHVHANVSVNVYWCDLQICPQTALVIDAHSHGRLNRYGKQSVVMRVEIDKLSLPKLASLITPCAITHGQETAFGVPNLQHST